jgi:hypothetical protein
MKYVYACQRGVGRVACCDVGPNSECNVDFPTGHDRISSRNSAGESEMAITSCVLNVNPTRMHLPEMAAEIYKTLLTTG